MINIEIEGKKLEDVLKEKDVKIEELEKNEKAMNAVISKNRATLELQSTELKDLQSQIIEMQTEEVKERKSLWQFLTGFVDKPKDEPKQSSRLTESTVQIDK